MRAGRAAADAAGRFPPVGAPTSDGVVGVGADLEPGTLLAAYRRGLFPMPLDRRAAAAGLVVARPAGRRARSTALRVSRSLRRRRAALRGPGRHRLRRGGARRAPTRPGPAAWITPTSPRPTARLHELGLGPQRRGLGRRRAWPAGSTASPSAGCSPASRCSTAAPTPRRSRSSASSTCSRATAPTASSTCSGRTDHLRTLGAVEVPRSALPRAASPPPARRPLPPRWA